jgi:hypothetical protein
MYGTQGFSFWFLMIEDPTMVTWESRHRKVRALLAVHDFALTKHIMDCVAERLDAVFDPVQTR